MKLHLFLVESGSQPLQSDFRDVDWTLVLNPAFCCSVNLLMMELMVSAVFVHMPENLKHVDELVMNETQYQLQDHDSEETVVA